MRFSANTFHEIAQLKISFLIKGLKKSHRNHFNYDDVSVGKVKILTYKRFNPRKLMRPQ